MNDNFSKDILDIEGPILILGASSFIGSALYKKIADIRDDVYPVINRGNPWRLSEKYAEKIVRVNLFSKREREKLFDNICPKTVFYLISYGGFQNQDKSNNIYDTNSKLLIEIVESLRDKDIKAFIHAGSSSEYGFNLDNAKECYQLLPKGHYGISKAQASMYLNYAANRFSFPCLNLRLFSVYGPFEDSGRLIPKVVINGIDKKYVNFASPDISRDFIYIEDVLNAFIKAAQKINNDLWGKSLNICTGVKTTLRDVSILSKELFNIDEDPVFNNYTDHCWDQDNWYGNPELATEQIGFVSITSLKDGLLITKKWIEKIRNNEQYFSEYIVQSKKNDIKIISIVVVCYKDTQAMPVLHEEVQTLFKYLNYEYQLIFAVDGCPDGGDEVVKDLSGKDSSVSGITHLRNYGVMEAFRSGMEMAHGDACIIMDGDLQDPVSMIPQMIEQWENGNDTVVGIRSKRDEPFWLMISRRFFYILFNFLSREKIIRDAGEFSLMDKSVYQRILEHKERGALWRALRSLSGTKTKGVKYFRPKRRYGETNNSIISNLGWVKYAIVSFSPKIMILYIKVAVVITLLSFTFMLLTVFSVKLIALSAFIFLVLILFGVGVIGLYVENTLIESKKRPGPFKRFFIRHGKMEIYNDEII